MGPDAHESGAAVLTILTFTQYYLPGYLAGGPIQAISNMAAEFSDQFEFRIVCKDRDAGAAHPYPDVPVDQWVKLGKAHVYYLSPGARSLRKLTQLMRNTPHDMLYLNSFFDPVFTLQPLLIRRLGLIPRKPLIVAPRGEFASSAMKLKQRKKSIYLTVAKNIGMYAHAIWQASSEHEAADIVRAMAAAGSKKMQVLVCPEIVGRISLDGTDEVSCEHVPSATGMPVRLCFLSRITPIKNLDYALQVLAQVQAPVRLSIYGPCEDAMYWAKCEQLIAALPPHIEAVYYGGIGHAQVVPTLKQHDLLILPTQGENFGHVVHEALLAGTPVLLSDQTPWRDLEQLGVGWSLPLNAPAAFVHAIDAFASWDGGKKQAMRRTAQAYATRFNVNQDTVNVSEKLFLQASQEWRS